MRPAPVPSRAEAGLVRAFDAIAAPGAVQRAAMEVFLRGGLPHRRIEEWKWTDLRAAVAEWDLTPHGEGRFAASRAPDRVAPLVSAPTTALPALAAALTGEAEVFAIAGAPSEPLALTLEARRGAVHRIVAVRLAPGAQARVVERYRGEPGGFGNLGILYQLGEGARLERVIALEESPGAALIVSGAAELAAGAQLRQTTLAFGAALARLETHVQMSGEGASAQLAAATLLGGALHADHTTTVEHAAPGGTTAETFRSVVADEARSVFQGRITVARGAQKTDARMRHDALLLNEGATAHAKPELMIHADDVACAHGVSAGALDREQLFYLQARGLPEGAARAILVRAFVAEALAEASEDARAGLEAEIDRWLEARR